MAVWVMHGLTVKLCTMLRRTLAASRHGSVVTLPEIKTMIDMSVKMIRPVVPRSSADEYTTGEPLWAIVAIRGAVIRGSFIVSVRACRRFSDADRDLGGRLLRNSNEEARRYCH
jgi:hypothetical protein